MFGQYDSPKTPKVPTIKQFMKTASKSIQGKTKFGVDLIWLPGQFDNVTLQTHAFRVIATNNHPLYKEVITYTSLLELGNTHSRLDVIIDDIETELFSVVESSRVRGTWKKLGSNGLAFETN